jgi:uncharacterized protein (DUF58 family)
LTSRSEPGPRGPRRRWPRPPRRLRVLRPGGYLLAGILALGLATLNTGNNLLFLLLGALLGLVVLSGWLSEQTLRDVRVARRVPRAATAGAPAWIEYSVRRDGAATAGYALEIGEIGWPGCAFVQVLEPGDAATVRLAGEFARRGVVELDTIVVATAFPFGLFRKSCALHAADRLVVWPRSDRRVRAPAFAAGGGVRRELAAATRATPGRADFRALRPYRAGDDPRDVHWRASARAGEPIVREHEHAMSETWWLCLDTRGRQGARQEEAAVEIAASLAAGAVRRGEPVGFAAAGERLAPAAGYGQLDAILDALAAVAFSPDAPPPVPPAAAACVLVAPRAARRAGFADVFTPETT